MRAQIDLKFSVLPGTEEILNLQALTSGKPSFNHR